MGTIMGTLWERAQCAYALLLSFQEKMARPNGFEPLTPRFVVFRRQFCLALDGSLPLYLLQDVPENSEEVNYYAPRDNHDPKISGLPQLHTVPCRCHAEAGYAIGYSPVCMSNLIQVPSDMVPIFLSVSRPGLYMERLWGCVPDPLATDAIMSVPGAEVAAYPSSSLFR